MPDNINFHFQNPDESPGYLLWQLSMIWQRRQKKALDPLQLTHTQFVLLAALAWLSAKSGQVTQVDIANHSNTDRMMVSKVLRTLQVKKLITRQEHETDTRAKLVKLTPAGEKLLQKALKAVEDTDIAFFSILGAKANSFNAGMLKLIRENREE